MAQNLYTPGRVRQAHAAADIFKRKLQVGDVEPVIMDALYLELPRELDELTRHEVETDDRAVNTYQVPCLKPLFNSSCSAWLRASSCSRGVQ